MKKAIFTGICYDISLEERFRLIKQAGFDAVLAWWGDGDENDYAKFSEKYSLPICNAHLPWKTINDIWRDNTDGEELTLRLCNLVKKCSELSVPVGVVHVSASQTPPPYCTLGIERFRRILETAEDYGVDIAFENLRVIEYLDYVMSNLSSLRKKYCFDSGHQHYRYPEIDVLAKYGSLLRAVHLHDNMGDFDAHLLPFDGTINWDLLAEKFALIGYEGEIALEVHADKETLNKLSPSEYLERAFERATRLESIFTANKNKEI